MSRQVNFCIFCVGINGHWPHPHYTLHNPLLQYASRSLPLSQCMNMEWWSCPKRGSGHCHTVSRQPFENMVNIALSLSLSPYPSLSLCQDVGRSWEVLMEKLLLLFPLFTTLMWKAPSMLQLCVAMTRPPCHSPLVTELMGRPQKRKTGRNRWREKASVGKDTKAKKAHVTGALLF